MKIQNPLLMALSVVCALGAGITGTLLWTENRPDPPAQTPAQSPTAPPTLPNIPLPNPAFSGTSASGASTSGTSTSGTSTSGTSTSGTSTSGTSTSGTSTSGTSASGTSASGTSASGTSASGTSGGQETRGGSQVPPAGLTSGMSPSEAALALGNWNYDHEKWDEAIGSYTAAIQDGVDNPNIRTDLGNALRFSDRPQEALKQYQIAQKQDPTHEQSLFNQGALYAVSLKNPRQGIEAWRAYLKRFPTGGSAAKARELLTKFSSK